MDTWDSRKMGRLMAPRAGVAPLWCADTGGAIAQRYVLGEQVVVGLWTGLRTGFRGGTWRVGSGIGFHLRRRNRITPCGSLGPLHVDARPADDRQRPERRGCGEREGRLHRARDFENRRSDRIGQRVVGVRLRFDLRGKRLRLRIARIAFRRVLVAFRCLRSERMRNARKRAVTGFVRPSRSARARPANACRRRNRAGT